MLSICLVVDLCSRLLVNGSLNSQGSKAINGVVHGCLNRKFNFFDLE